MTIPDAIWSTRLENGDTLGERVGKKPPTMADSMSVEALASFLMIWQQRRDDARSRKLQDLEQKSRKILAFIESDPSDEFAYLGWSDPRVGALYNVTEQKIFILSEGRALPAS